MQLCRWSISPLAFQTEISTGSPLLSIVRAVVICIERAIIWMYNRKVLQTKGTVLSVCVIISNWYCDWYMPQMAQIFGEKWRKGHRTNRTYPTYRTPTRWLVDLPPGKVDKKRSGTREGARPEWSYSIDMCQIKLIRALDQQLRELCLRRCFRT